MRQQAEYPRLPRFGRARGRNAKTQRRLPPRAVKAIDETICKLQLFSEGLKHAARCPAPEHTECALFKKLVRRGLRLIKQ